MKMRNDWDSLQYRVRELEGKLDVSKTLVQGIVSERNLLRTSFEDRQMMLQGEDQTTLADMQRLLEEITADGATLSPAQILNRFAEATERSAESFAKRAEVSPAISYFYLLISNLSTYHLPCFTNMGTSCKLPHRRHYHGTGRKYSSPPNDQQRQRLTRTRSGASSRSGSGLFSSPRLYMPLFIPRPPVSFRSLLPESLHHETIACAGLGLCANRTPNGEMNTAHNPSK